MTMTRDEAIEVADELTEIKMEIEALLERAEEALRGTGMIARRAQAYWLGHLADCLDGRGCMATMADTIRELTDGDDDAGGEAE
jgi:hypothetical protein